MGKIQTALLLETFVCVPASAMHLSPCGENAKIVWDRIFLASLVLLWFAILRLRGFLAGKQEDWWYASALGRKCNDISFPFFSLQGEKVKYDRGVSGCVIVAWLHCTRAGLCLGTNFLVSRIEFSHLLFIQFWSLILIRNLPSIYDTFEISRESSPITASCWCQGTLA